MNKIIALLTIAVFAITTSVSFAQKKKKVGSLDGQKFEISISEAGKKAKPDELSFKSNKVVSAMFDEKNILGPVVYSTEDSSTVEEDFVKFEATGTNEKKEDIVWKGLVNAEEIQGTAIISKNGKTKKSYSFTGTLAKKKK